MLMLKLDKEKLSSLLFLTRVTLKLTKRESLMPLLTNSVSRNTKMNKKRVFSRSCYLCCIFIFVSSNTFF